MMVDGRLSVTATATFVAGGAPWPAVVPPALLLRRPAHAHGGRPGGRLLRALAWAGAGAAAGPAAQQTPRERGDRGQASALGELAAGARATCGFHGCARGGWHPGCSVCGLWRS